MSKHRRPRKEEAREQAAARRRFLRLAGALLLVAVVAMGLSLVIGVSRTRVDWARVLAASANAKTVHGVATFVSGGRDDWDYGLWARVDGPANCPSQGMLVPAGGTQTRKVPDPETLGICSTLNLYGKQGVVTQLAREKRRTRGQWATWNSEKTLRVTESLPVPLAGTSETRAASWQLYLDPGRTRVKAVEVSLGGKVRARVEYEYGRPVPAGFRPEGE